MKIKILNAVDMDLGHEFVKKVSSITAREENLSFRSPSIIRHAIQKGDFLVAQDEERKIVGWIEKYFITGNWWGLSSLYVFPNFRDKGIGKGMLIPAVVATLSGKNIFAASANALVFEKLKELEFEKISLSEVPTKVKLFLLLRRYLNFQSLWKLNKLKDRKFSYFIRRVK